MKFLAGGAALMCGVGVWLLVRPQPSDVGTPGSRPDNLVRAHGAPVASARSGMPAAKEETARRPSMIGPTGAILTGGKSLEEVQIRYWAESYDFEITDDELRQAQEAYNAVTAARRKWEDSLVQVERKTPSHFKIVIPAYLETGLGLRQQFEADLVSVLGEGRARDFLSKIGTSLERAHFGWGMTDQVLDVVLRRSGGVEILEIAHGFALADSGVLTDIAGVSNSLLTPDDLGIYAYLRRHFPKEAAD